MKKINYYRALLVLACSLATNTLSVNAYSENELAIETIYNEDIAKYDLYITEYCDYYHLNPEVIIPLIREYTNNYSYVGDLSINGELISLDNPDKFAMNFVYYIYNKMDEFDLKKEDCIITNELDVIDNEELLLSNGYYFDDYVAKIATYQNIDKNLVLAIIAYETNFLDSFQAMGCNNYGGLKGKRGYLRYPTPEAGIISVVMNIDRIYSKNIIKNYEDLSAIYVNGNINKPSKHWVNSVLSIKNDFEDDFMLASGKKNK